MGKLSKKFNQKARQQQEKNQDDVQEDNKKQKDLQHQLGIESNEYCTNTGESNALVLVKGDKKSRTLSTLNVSKKRVLSKKQQKKLQRIVDQKGKAARRQEILKTLEDSKVSDKELSMFISTASMKQLNPPKRQLEDEAVEEDAAYLMRKPRKRKKKKKDKSLGAGGDSDGIVGVLKQETNGSSEDCESSDISDEESSNKDEQVINLPLDAGDKSDIQENSSTIANDSSIEKIEENIAIQEPGSTIDHITEQKDVSKSVENISFTKDREVPIFVKVERKKEVQAARLLLPILPEEQVVMETIMENDVVVICGETGSGKTTQVPQFLYEAGYGSHPSRKGMIGITEPRRVAAVSMSKRVSTEMSMSNSVISYQIRYEGNVSNKTAMKFMTDGVLLKEMESDFLLSKYSVIIIDEAHERSVFTDILIGLLSRVVPLRKKQGKPLKLIIMSATLRIEDFTENKQLFSAPPPILKIDSRQYPVTIHFNKRTRDDYVTESFNKICKIHRTLKNDGGILVFLTGQNEVLALCRKLKKAFPVRQNKSKIEKVNIDEKSNVDRSSLPKLDLDNYSSNSLVAESHYDDREDDEDYWNMIDDNKSDSEDADSDNDMDDSCYTSALDADIPLHVLPLFSLLSTDKQSKVFEAPPEGTRLCVVATNVAETSLTIPGIKYIVDSGRVKKKFYDKITGVSTFKITWTSKASANQRAGRAGRVGPGHCYRLYSSAVFQNDFEEFAEAEICRRPVDDLVLQMKGMCIDRVLNFPFPSPPSKEALKAAEELLLDLGALTPKKTKSGQLLAVISNLGKSLIDIPVAPRFAKMIMLSLDYDGCLPYVITIVAALTVKELFTDDIDLSDVADFDKEDAKKKRFLITQARRKWAGDGPSSFLGDLLVILRAVGACEFSGCSEKFCKDNGLRYKAMTEIRKLRVQITNAVNGLRGCSHFSVDPKMPPPSSEQTLSIRKILLSCFGDRVARKVPADEAKTLKIKNAYQCCSTDDPVYIHPTSSLFTKLPEFIVYQEIMETSKLYMKTLTCVETEWLPVLAPYKCTFGKPQDIPSPSYDSDTGIVKCYMDSTYGPHLWQINSILLDYPDCPEKYRHFGRFFLEGQVCQKLARYAKKLLSPSSVMIKSWSHLHQRTEKLLGALLEKRVESRSKLDIAWKTDPQFLLKPYLDWLPENLHEEIRQIWPPV